MIVTAASDQGMVDIHDRRPMVLSPEHAREWMGNNLERKIAEELALSCCQPTENFEWHPVGKAVGNVKSQGPELIKPLKS